MDEPDRLAWLNVWYIWRVFSVLNFAIAIVFQMRYYLLDRPRRVGEIEHGGASAPRLGGSEETLISPAAESSAARKSKPH